MATRATAPYGPWAQRLMIGAFTLLLCLPLLGMLLRLDAGGDAEKRRLAPPPPLSLGWKAPTRFMQQCQAYLSDNFGFRSTLLRWNALVNARRLAVSPTPKVVMGREGWLFFAGDGAMEEFRRSRPFAPADLDAWQGMLERRSAWLERRGIPYLVVLVPASETVYGEMMPARYTRLGDRSRLDQLAERLRGTRLDVLDLRPALLEAKKHERVWQRTDSHWNDLGAFVAYQEILRRAGVRVKGLEAPLARGAFRLETRLEPGHDLAVMMGMGDLYVEEYLALVPLAGRQARRSVWEPGRLDAFRVRPERVAENVRPAPGPRLVMFHDSFGPILEPFLAEHFGRSIFVWNALSFDEDFLEREKPDLVVQQVAERYVMSSLEKPLRQDPRGR